MQQNYNQPQWVNALQKSLLNNQQLEFINISSVAYIYKDDPCIDNILFDKVECIQSDNQSQSDFNLLYTIDARKNAFQEMQNNHKVEICWYFPLTKEQYKFKCHFSYFNSEKDSITSYEQETLNEGWKRTNTEKRKEFHEAHPDTYKESSKKMDDLDKFNMQNKCILSPNYVLLLFKPFRIEHTSFAMPQVIADGRKQFESLFKPYKKNQKILYLLDKNEWKISELNP